MKRKRLKPIKAWAVITDYSKTSFYDVYHSREDARCAASLYATGRVIRVEIREVTR